MSYNYQNKRIRASMTRILALTLVFLIFLSGCSDIFSKDYIVIRDHEDGYKELEQDSSVQTVSNYADMRNAVMNFVSNSIEYGVIRTKNYYGDVTEDISRACHEVTRETPLGVYAVEYMSHKPTNMLSYYEIELSISFKKSREEINSVVRVNSGPELYQNVDAAIESGADSIAILQVSSSIDKETIIKHVHSFYRNNPQLVYELPDMTINEYPNTEAIQKIIDIQFEYSRPQAEISERMKALNSMAERMASGLEAEDEAHTALKLTERLITATIYYRARNVIDKYRAYDAIVKSEAAAEGYAMAFKLLCNIADIDCRVIEGRLNSERHYWNIIKIGSDYYHVDTFMCDINGIETAFLKRDNELWGRYWWDTKNYDECKGILTYADLVELPEPPAESEEDTEPSA